MSKHTQGPWKIRKNYAYEEYWVTREHWDAGPAKIVYDLADARLIAAAPDLLLALKNLELGVSLLDARLTHDHKNSSTAWEQLNQYLQDARIAITKAEAA